MKCNIQANFHNSTSFINFFHSTEFKGKMILVFDEFHAILSLKEEIRNDFLSSLEKLKNDSNQNIIVNYLFLIFRVLLELEYLNFYL